MTTEALCHRNMKLPLYSGQGPLKTYLVLVQVVASFNSRSSKKTGSCVGGPAASGKDELDSH